MSRALLNAHKLIPKVSGNVIFVYNVKFILSLFTQKEVERECIIIA